MSAAPPGFTLRHELEPRTGNYEWVYLWHWPLRAMHWVAAIAIVVLAVTGLYIGRPYFAPTASATTPFAMGWMRFLHFLAAAALVATGIVRVYWLFAGNKFERLAALSPRQADIIELHFFAGLTMKEAGAVLGICERTAYTDWRIARAWLRREMQGA